MGNESGRVVEVLAGRVRTHDWPLDVGGEPRAWRTGYIKDAVSGAVHAGTLGLAGDEQGDRRHHGGPDRALLAYADAHYAVWRRELSIPEMGPGGFGENLVVTGFDEHSVCIGDVVEVGTARVQVTQPRGPCANISRRWNRPELLQRVVDTLRFGWYLRVLEEGEVRAGDAYRVIERPCPEWTVAAAFEIKRDPAGRRDELARLAACPALSATWREALGRRVREMGGTSGGGA